MLAHALNLSRRGALHCSDRNEGRYLVDNVDITRVLPFEQLITIAKNFNTDQY